MASLCSGSINLSKIDKDNVRTDKKGNKWYDFTLSINDRTSDYGDNIGIYNPQTKEEIEAKSKKQFVGNAKVFWTDGKITVAEKVEKEESTDDLPF